MQKLIQNANQAIGADVILYGSRTQTEESEKKRSAGNDIMVRQFSQPQEKLEQ